MYGHRRLNEIKEKKKKKKKKKKNSIYFPLENKLLIKKLIL